MIIGLHVVISTLHVLVWCNAYNCYVGHLSNPTPTTKRFYRNGGYLKFFTYWTLFVHTLTFGSTLVTDFIDNSSIISTRDLLFNALALPFGLFVSTFFWSLYAYDRQLVRPKVVEEIEPQWATHILHTLPSITSLLDLCLVDRKRREMNEEVLLMFSILTLYLCYLLYIGVFRNDWVYPVLIKFNKVSRAKIAIAFYATCILHYCLGCILFKLKSTFK